MSQPVPFAAASPATVADAGHQPELTELATATHRSFLVLVVAVVAVLAYLGLAQIKSAVVGSGTVKVDLNRKLVQHQDGGVVRTLLVRDGQKVAAGQVVVELADVAVDASVELVRTQHDGEWARSVRLSAEREFAGSFTFPPELESRRSDRTLRDVMERERSLFASRRETLTSQIELMRRQIAEVQREAEAMDRQIATEREALALQRDELKVNEGLLEQGFVQRTRVMTLQRAVSEYTVRLSEHEADLARARQKANDLELRIMALRNEYTEAATRELRESTARLHELQQRLRPSEDAARRQRISAPVAGEVVGLRPISPGTVIGPRDVLMEIVPSDARLIVEGQVRPQDITHLQVGSHAELRLTAFRYRDTPTVAGTVEHVAADVTNDERTGMSYYVVRVAVSPESLKDAGAVYLQAGMPVEFFITTPGRSIASYLLEPVTSYLRRSLRES